MSRTLIALDREPNINYALTLCMQSADRSREAADPGRPPYRRDFRSENVGEIRDQKIRQIGATDNSPAVGRQHRHANLAASSDPKLTTFASKLTKFAPNF